MAEEPREVARTVHGMVFAAGEDIWIDYAVEAGARIPHRTLSGGRMGRINGARIVTFRQPYTPGRTAEGVVLIVTSATPGLAELVELAERHAAALRDRRDKRALRGMRKRDPEA